MADSKVTIKLESHLDEAKIDFKRALKQWGEAVGGEMVNLTHRPKSNGGAPVDTGLLRNSMAYAVGGEKAHTIDGSSNYKNEDGKKGGSYSGLAEKDKPGKHTVYVGSNVEYAEIVEDGGQGRKPARMCRNAVRDVKDFAEDFLNFALENNKTI